MVDPGELMLVGACEVLSAIHEEFHLLYALTPCTRWTRDILLFGGVEDTLEALLICSARFASLGAS